MQAPRGLQVGEAIERNRPVKADGLESAPTLPSPNPSTLNSDVEN